tara:strand:- start:559 stop:792 length:234 start_codon:yes stop_codon:yes gene_type:complete
VFHNDKGASNELKEEDGTVGDVVAAGVVAAGVVAANAEDAMVVVDWFGNEFICIVCTVSELFCKFNNSISDSTFLFV